MRKLFLFALLSIGGAMASPVVVPPGVNPGDSYRLVFVTSTSRNASSTNIADYDAFVTGVANSAPELAQLGASWQVIGSTPSVAAVDHIGVTDVPIFRLDGLRVADNTADLWDGSIQNAILVTESGTTLFTGLISTGTSTSGNIYPGFALGNPNIVVGNMFSTATDGTWIQVASSTSGPSRQFYAISSTITFNPVPEPTTMSLLAAGCTLLVIGAKRRRRVN